jgi:hypothetical protein
MKNLFSYFTKKANAIKTEDERERNKMYLEKHYGRVFESGLIDLKNVKCYLEEAFSSDYPPTLAVVWLKDGSSALIATFGRILEMASPNDDKDLTQHLYRDLITDF